MRDQLEQSVLIYRLTGNIEIFCKTEAKNFSITPGITASNHNLCKLSL